MPQYRFLRWRLDLAALRAWSTASSDASSARTATLSPESQKSASTPKNRYAAIEAELTQARKRIVLLEQQRTRLKFDVTQAQNQVSLLDQQRTWLTVELTQAQDRIYLLEAQLEREHGNIGQLFREVGLDQSCPDFVIKAARTAYRKALHPDAQPERHRSEAERRFMETEAIFAELYWHRGVKD